MKTKKSSQNVVMSNLRKQLEQKREMYYDMGYKLAIQTVAEEIYPVNKYKDYFDYYDLPAVF